MPVKVKVKVTKWVFNAESLEKVSELLAAMKEITHPLIFNANVEVIEP